MWVEMSSCVMPTMLTSNSGDVADNLLVNPLHRAPCILNHLFKRLFTGFVKKIDAKKLVEKLKKDKTEKANPFHVPITMNTSKTNIIITSIQFIYSFQTFV